MPNPPPTTAAERFAWLAQYVSDAVAKRTGWALTLQIIALITTRLGGIKRRVQGLAARIGAGQFTPRPVPAAPPPRPGQRPPANKLPNRFGWLRPMIAETIEFAGLLDALLRDPEMVALLAAAPAAMRRPVRSFCWMLGVAPPAILALPPRRKPPPAPPPAAPEAKPERQSPHAPRPRTRLGFYRDLPPLAATLAGPRRKNSG